MSGTLSSDAFCRRHGCHLFERATIEAFAARRSAAEMKAAA
jgi:hypothetical protein